MPEVMIIMGSASDWEKTKPCLQVLENMGVAYEATISSAHRTPARTDDVVRDAEQKGAKVFICVAGMAAHLAGAVAARTLCPVIGVPLSGAALGGMDALYSTVQMPSGFPVATVALDGARNAAYLAIQILALDNAAFRERLADAREEMRRAVEEDARRFLQGQ